jgi:hypothetical protein
LKKDTACTESAQNGLFLDMIEGYDATTVLATAQSGIFRLRHYHKMPKNVIPLIYLTIVGFFKSLIKA